jgi:hypothetical protein
MCKEARAALLAAAASNVAPVRNQRCAQASPATKAAPPVKRRFESSLARRLLTLGTAGVHAERAVAARHPRGQAAASRPPDSRVRASRLRRRCSCSSPPPTPSPATCATCARCRVFESGAGTEPARYVARGRTSPNAPTSRAGSASSRLRRARQSPMHAHGSLARVARRPRSPARRKGDGCASGAHCPSCAGGRAERAVEASHGAPPDSRARGEVGFAGAARALRRPRSRRAGSAQVRCPRRRGSKGALARNQRAMQRPRFAANEGSAAREAAFRIELRAPASPARCHRRAGVRAERAGGPAGTRRPPDSRARARGFAGAARALSPARRRAVAARAGAARKWRWHGSSAAQVSLPTKAAPTVKLRFEASLARRLLPLSAARAHAPSAPSGPGARGQTAAFRALNTFHLFFVPPWRL